MKDIGFVLYLLAFVILICLATFASCKSGCLHEIRSDGTALGHEGREGRP